MVRGLPIGKIPSLKEFEATGEGPNEFRSRDGKTQLTVQLRPQAARDLQATYLRLAQKLSKDRKLTRGIVATWLPKPSNKRVFREWKAAWELFKPEIARRMELVVVRPEECLTSKDDRELTRIGEALRAHLSRRERPQVPSRPPLSEKFFEVFKVLLDQWILGRGPIAVGELMRRVGCSYPTAADAIRRLEGSQEIARRSRRSVQLTGFPKKTWTEVLALSESLRKTQYYADPTGRTPAPLDLYRRLKGVPYKHIGVGGVQAARHWDPHFDLHGLPRLDITSHMASGIGDLGFLEKLDPALKAVSPGAPRVVLAVHPLFRAEPCFEKNPKGKIDWADPVETLLDLHELRLVDQAEELTKRLSGRIAP